MEELKCVVCGKELKKDDEGRAWRKCTICKKPVCFDHLRYMGVWRRGLYRDYVEVVPVCENDMPKKRRRVTE
ncbi:hypothetical protein [Archaeoglobus veneficus]|uniref:Uncharacterized protein n=1 Tax=Archaeoglobus veneficus (strain DSM 11195 / SNP6) TaxID=693661 RepID=F2KPH9_ARCVS|nr:hypothetical protein [Archaeoglobus veneficus]AEA46410.1 hypothetical protein Arcve_0377 [Archaeoglobus veneficus SNP6]